MGKRPPSSPTQPLTCEAPCGQPFFFAITTPGQKLIPVNATPDPDGILAIRHEASGAYLARVLRNGQEPDPATEKRYTAHFASCPLSAAHRKNRPARRPQTAGVAQDALFGDP